MGIKVAMRYGTVGTQTEKGAFDTVRGTLTDEDSTTLSFSAGGLYELSLFDYNNSTGAFRFAGQWLIVAPEETDFSSTAPTRISVATSGTSAHSFSWSAGGTCTLTATSATYNVKYAVKRIL